jgi:putative component of toxin-antitoxin plasmid stabilization module
MLGSWKLEFFEDDEGRAPMEKFLDTLPDAKFAALDAALSQVLARDGLGLAGSQWLKPLGDGLHEFRVRHSQAEILALHRSAGYSPPPSSHTTPVLIRVFVHFFGNRVCLLLGGYDKGRDTSQKRQQREIATARKHLTRFRLSRRDRLQ